MPSSLTAQRFPLALSLLLIATGATSLAGAAATGVTLHDNPADGKVRIEIDGQLFANYGYQNTSRPYLFPVHGPDGTLLSRRWPLQDSTDEEHDHPHHRSLWYAHGDINGVDFWSESPNAGRTVHLAFQELESGQDVGTLHSANALVDKDGHRIATANHLLRIHRHPNVRILDYTVTILASEGPLTFGDTKEGSMAIRLAESMRLKPNRHYSGQPTGHIVNNQGVRDSDTWGKRAAWVDYHGPVNGKTVGVAIFDHPSNPRHPTWWHVRDYGLFAANPFGIHDFEKQPAGSGNLQVAAGNSVAFQYRFIFHRGDEKDARIADLYHQYAK